MSDFLTQFNRGRWLHGMYRWNAFDISLLIPYFVVMIILAFYGVHRYQLVWLYYRNRRNAAHSSCTKLARRALRLPMRLAIQPR